MDSMECTRYHNEGLTATSRFLAPACPFDKTKESNGAVTPASLFTPGRRQARLKSRDFWLGAGSEPARAGASPRSQGFLQFQSSTISAKFDGATTGVAWWVTS